MKKTIRDAFEMMMIFPGKRFLFWGVIALAALGLSMIIPGVFAPVMVICFFNALSFIPKVSVEYVESLSVPSSDGKWIQCAVVREKDYAFMPVFPFVCLFFYVPYRVRYHIIKYAAFSGISPKTKLNNEFLSIPGIFHSKELRKKEYLFYKTNIQELRIIYDDEAKKDRICFMNTVKPFVDAGILYEVFFGDFFSVCSLTNNNDIKLFFQYSGKDRNQSGIIISNKTAEDIKSNLLDASSVLFAPNTSLEPYLSLDDITLERMVRSIKPSKTAGDAADPDTTCSGSDSDLPDLNNKKKPLTEAVISSVLNRKATWKIVAGAILCFLSLYGFFGFIAGITTGIVFLAIIGIPLGLLLVFFGVKKIRKGKQDIKDILDQKYRIEKAQCNVSQVCQDDEGYVTYEYVFNNGISVNRPVGSIGIREGDSAYFVFLNDEKPVIFNGMEWYYSNGQKEKIND